jgi:hypothetical protein
VDDKHYSAKAGTVKMLYAQFMATVNAPAVLSRVRMRLLIEEQAARGLAVDAGQTNRSFALAGPKLYRRRVCR